MAPMPLSKAEVQRQQKLAETMQQQQERKAAALKRNPPRQVRTHEPWYDQGKLPLANGFLPVLCRICGESPKDHA